MRWHAIFACFHYSTSKLRHCKGFSYEKINNEAIFIENSTGFVNPFLEGIIRCWIVLY